MNLLRILLLLFIVTVPTCFIGCSKHKLRLPVEEISRPLSIPPRNWRIVLGGGAFVRNDQMNDPEFDIDFDFKFPNIPLGSRWEYHIPASFKFYLLKNTEIKDSIVQITGKNIAVSAGFAYLEYVETLGLMAAFNATIDYKHPVTEKLWLLSNFLINYTTISQDYYASLEAGAGYQLSKRFYATIVPSLDQYRSTSYNNLNEKLEIVEELRFIVPVLIGVNITRKWSTYWRNEAFCWYKDNDWVFRSMLGFQVTW